MVYRLSIDEYQDISMFLEDIGGGIEGAQPSQAETREEYPQPSEANEAARTELPVIEKSQMCLVEEHRPDVVYRMFGRAVAEGASGLCVTRAYPGILSQKFDFRDSVMLWLSNAGMEDSVRPRDLEKLSLLLEQFLSEKGGVVLIDGIEYLITNNDFVTVLRLIQSIRDQVAMNEAVMIISLNPSTLGYQELNLLEREMDSVVRLCRANNENKTDFHVR